ncbi:MAG: DUF2716 domain-containing protein [Subdoligranulum sp.]|nr:DUF2716 domain-containing protein [Subdoligranulum sp.]
MQIILDPDQYDRIWDKVQHEFHFSPYGSPYGCTDQSPWISFPFPCKKYRLDRLFSEEQEKIIRSIFRNINPREMYALDWQHGCFLYDPREEIPFGYWFHDATRNCNVYFPSYYPDGDYHFFASLDWSIGLYGHPWREEMIVAGEALIREFERVQNALPVTAL